MSCSYSVGGVGQAGGHAQAAHAFLVAVLADVFEDAPGRVLAAQVAVVEHLAAVGGDVVEDVAGVGDDEARGLAPGAQLLHGVAGLGRPAVLDQLAHGAADEGHVLQVHAGLGLVEEDERGLLGHELEDLRALDLAAGEAGVDVALQELVEVHLAGHAFEIHVPAAGDEFQHLAHGQAVDGRRALEGHAQPEPGALVGRGGGDVLALEDDLAFGHGIVAEAHQGHQQAGLARAVGAE